LTYTRDTIAPVITVTASGTLGCNPTSGQIAAAFGTASVTDNCSSGLSATGTVGSETGSGCTFSKTKSWTVTDNCGNTGTASQTLTYTRDTIAPVITVTAAGTLGCNPTSGQIAAAFGTASVTDNCSSGLSATGTVGSETGSGCTFSTTKSWTITDNCGNTGTASQTITYSRDTVGPIFTSCPGNIVTGLCQPVTYVATATDNCTGSPAISYSIASGSVFPVGTTTVTVTAQDDCGNQSTCSFTVTINPDPTCSLTPPSPLPVCGSTGNILCATTTNAATYQWTILSGIGWYITSGADSSCMIYTAGSSTTATIQLVVTNSDGCTDTCVVTYGCTSPYWGCTLGFWKNHTSIWFQAIQPLPTCVAAAITAMGSGYSGNGTATSSFATTFGVNGAQMTAAGYSPSLTLLQALNLGGGGFQLLARQGVAALLNTCGLSGFYYYNSTQVLTMVHNAIVNLTPTPFGAQLDSTNEAQPDNCPPGGSANHRPSTPDKAVIDGLNVQVYPNPFTTSTTIEFTNEFEDAHVVVEVFTVSGSRVALLFDGSVLAGNTYKREFSANGLAQGMYFYRVVCNDQIINGKLILIQ
jgi:hypothetical protein